MPTISISVSNIHKQRLDKAFKRRGQMSRFFQDCIENHLIVNEQDRLLLEMQTVEKQMQIFQQKSQAIALKLKAINETNANKKIISVPELEEAFL